MKHWLQCVALALVALLAIPQGIAEGICNTLEPQPSMDMHVCCAPAGHDAMPSTGHARMAMARNAEMASCGEGCCSLAPQNSPPQGTPEKAQPDTLTAELATAGAAMTVSASSGARLHAFNPFDASAPARYLLLHVFRI